MQYYIVLNTKHKYAAASLWLERNHKKNPRRQRNPSCTSTGREDLEYPGNTKQAEHGGISCSIRGLLRRDIPRATAVDEQLRSAESVPLRFCFIRHQDPCSLVPVREYRS